MKSIITDIRREGRILEREDGTYAYYEILGIDEIVLEDCVEDGTTQFACWTCESEHFAGLYAVLPVG